MSADPISKSEPVHANGTRWAWWLNHVLDSLAGPSGLYQPNKTRDTFSASNGRETPAVVPRSDDPTKTGPRPAGRN